MTRIFIPTPILLSLMIYELHTFCDDEFLSSATCFLIKDSGRWHLVTNWHVLSGRNNETYDPADQDEGMTPNRIFYFSRGRPGEPFDPSAGNFSIVDDDGNPLWYESRTHKSAIDIAILPLGNHIPIHQFDILNSDMSDDSMWVDMGNNVLVPGYPLGLSAPGKLPLWKHGVLSGSTEFTEGTPGSLLIDVAANEGMSGSPVFSISHGTYYRIVGEGPYVEAVDIPFVYRLMGVFSSIETPMGHTSDPLHYPQICRAWSKEQMLDVLDGRRKAKIL